MGSSSPTIRICSILNTQEMAEEETWCRHFRRPHSLGSYYNSLIIYFLLGTANQLLPGVPEDCRSQGAKHGLCRKPSIRSGDKQILMRCAESPGNPVSLEFC